MITQQSDLSALAVQAKSDVESRNELIVATIDHMRPLASRWVGQMSEPDDLLNEFVLEVPKLIQRFKPDRASWLAFAGIRFQGFCRDFLRKSENHPTCHFISRNGNKITAHQGSLTGEQRNSLIDQECTTDRQRSGELDSLLHRLVGLSEMERTVCVLYYFYQFTLKEIGKAVGLSGSRISQIVKSAKRRVRQTVCDQDDINVLNRAA